MPRFRNANITLYSRLQKLGTWMQDDAGFLLSLALGMEDGPVPTFWLLL